MCIRDRPGRLEAHPLRGVELGRGMRQGVGDGLVLPDRPVEDDALLGVLNGPVERGAPDAHGLDAYDDALRVQRLEEMVEPLPDGADHVLLGDLEVLDRDLVRVDGSPPELVDEADADRLPIERREEAVSYTHLTLPTSDLV